MERAAALLPQLQEVYKQSQFAQAAINDYVANSDPTFNNAVNSIFTAGERSELQAMLTQLNSLVSNWSSQHAALLATVV